MLNTVVDARNIATSQGKAAIILEELNQSVPESLNLWKVTQATSVLFLYKLNFI